MEGSNSVNVVEALHRQIYFTTTVCVAFVRRPEFREFANSVLTSASDAHAVLGGSAKKEVDEDKNTTLLDLLKAYRRRIKMARAIQVILSSSIVRL